VWPLVGLFVLGCAAPPPPEPEPEPPPTLRPSAVQPPQPKTSFLFLDDDAPSREEQQRTSECFENPEAQAYFSSVRDAICASWQLPAGMEADQTVAVRIRIGASGELLEASLSRASQTPFGAAALDATRRAAPFGPMPPGAHCISELPLRTYFRNPSWPLPSGAWGPC